MENVYKLYNAILNDKDVQNKSSGWVGVLKSIEYIAKRDGSDIEANSDILFSQSLLALAILEAKGHLKNQLLNLSKEINS